MNATTLTETQHIIALINLTLEVAYKALTAVYLIAYCINVFKHLTLNL